jgi:hypothetical protein
MQRRLFLLTLSGVAALAAGTQSLRGAIARTSTGKPALKTADGRTVEVTGDADTLEVLADQRLANADIEVLGSMQDGVFHIGPMHTASLWVHQDGKRLRITYWCDICAIRTYKPGICWCCREETELDPRDPDTL